MQMKILKTIALICVVAFGFSMHVMAQEYITVSGTIYDESNATVPGAAILVKGTSIGTTSNLDGKFTLQVPTTAEFLEVSFVGMQTQQVPVSKEPMTIILVSATTELEEVVVIGYGTVKKNQVTTAISSVNEKELKNLRVTGIDQAMQGKLAGVTITNNSGQPGGGVALRVRGLTSINSNDPLIVIDGVPFKTNTVSSSGYDGLGGGRGQTGNSFLANINPNDIESIDILKDASAQAIYGSQAANGVIMITTKKGKLAEGKLTYDSYIGFAHQVNRLDLMDLRQFAKFQNQVLPLLGYSPQGEFQDPSILGEGTDWQEAIFKNGATQNHSISFSANRENLSYYISAGFLDQDGTLEGSDFRRYSSRFNLDNQIKSWFKVGMSANVTRSIQNVALADNAPSGTIWLACIQSPLTPVKNLDGSWGGGQTIGDITYYQDNPVAQSKSRGNKVTQNQVFGNLYADLKFLKDFSFKTEVSYTLGAQNNLAYQYATNIGTRILQSKMIDNRSNSYYWALRNYLNYNKTFGKHYVGATAGHEAQYSYYEAITGMKLDLQNDILDLNAGSTDTETWELSGGKNNWAMESYFVRGNYMFDNKYSLMISYRADASSNFGPNNKWGYFTGASASWTITNEKFMEPYKDILSNAKVRLGYGAVGNQNLPSGAANPPYTSGVTFWSGAVGFGTVGTSTTNFINGIANPDLSWEKVITQNIGFDFAFLKNKIELTLDLYKKTTSKMLLFTTGPTFLGIGSAWDDLKAPIGNVGQMTNKGIDLSITTHNFDKNDFQWTTSFVLSHYKNKLDKLLNESSTINGMVYYNGYTITKTAPGESVGSFYGLVNDGLYRTQEDLDNSLPQFGYGVNENQTWFGDVRYKDIASYDADGKRVKTPDGVINAADLTYIGSPIPKFTYGLTNNFTYKSFDASIFIQGSYGADIYNFLNWQLEKLDNAYYNQLATVADMYTSENTDGKLPRFTNTNTNNSYVSSRYVEDGSYLRIQNITLGYRLPANLINKAKISSLRVYMSMQNVYTFTKYSGYDPEIGSYDNTITLMNVDLGHYPNPRVITFGINCEF